MAESRITYGERYRFEQLIASISPANQDTQEDSEQVHAVEEETGTWEFRTAAMS